MLGAQESAGQIGIDCGLPLSQRQIFEVDRRGTNTCVVEEHLQPAKGRRCTLEQCRNRIRVRDIGRDCKCLTRSDTRLGNDLLERINALVRRSNDSKEAVELREKTGSSAFTLSVAQTRQFVADEVERWARYIRETGVKAE